MRKKITALFAVVFACFNPVFSQNIAVNTTGAANSTLSMLEVLQISTTANTKGLHVAHSGIVGGIGYGIWSEVTGASTTNIAGYFNTSGATNNYPGIFMGGNVGIGTVTPARRLDIQQSSDAVSSGIGIINAAGTSRLNLWSNGTSGEIDAGGTGQNFLLLNAGGGGGNVGIGTTAPGAKLDIAGASNGSGINLRTVGDIMVGTGTGSTIFFDGNYNYASGNYIQATAANTQTHWTSGVERMRITSAGNVGIGTTAPGAKLDVQSGGVGINIRTNYLDLHGDNGATTDRPYFRGTTSHLVINGGGTTAGGTLYLNYTGDGVTGDVRIRENLFVMSSGNVGVGTSVPAYPLEIASGSAQLANALSILPSTHATSRRASIKVDDWVMVQDINANGVKDFEIWQQSAALPRLNITTTGNVGIGTATPSAHLEVRDLTPGANSLTVTKDFNGFGNTNAAFIGGTDGVYGNTGIYVAQKDGLGLNSATSYIFNVVNNAVSQMLVTGLGDVGIGVAAPAAKLDVNGDIKFRNGAGSLFWSNVANRDFDILQSNTSTNRAFSVHSGPNSGSSFGNIVVDFYGNDGFGNNLPGFIMLKNGNVGIGTTAPSQKLDVAGNLIVSGNIYLGACGNWLTAMYGCSDIRYKKDIVPVKNALSDILKLQGVEYSWRQEEFPEMNFDNRREIGFIAQEMEKIFPEIVNTNDSGYKNIDYAKLTSVLVEAIKEQQKMIEKSNSDKLIFEMRIMKLETANEQLKANAEARIEKLEAVIEKILQAAKEEAKK